MPKKHLTYQFINSLSQPESKEDKKRVEYYDQHSIDPESNTIKKKGVKGLLVRLTKAGSKYFYYGYWFDKGAKKYKIGTFPNISLSEARNEARRLARKVNEGEDPQAEKNKRKYKPKEMTFKELATLFSKRHLPTLKERTRNEYQRHIDVELLNKHEWGDIEVSELTSQHVREVLNYKAYEENAFTSANRIRSTISSIFSFGLKHVGLNLEKNPVTNTAKFEQGENVRERVYSEDEIKELWEYWETKDEPIQSVFKMLLLTGQRKTETIRMKWEDIEYDKPCKRIEIGEDGRPRQKKFLTDIWTIPASMAKNGQAQEVPLTGKALELLENLKPLTGKSDYVFESQLLDNEPIEDIKATAGNIKEKTSISDFRPHDLRSTFTTRLEENLVDEIVIKKLLNHKSEGVTGRHYQWYNYTDKKLQALNRWSWRLESILSEEKTEANITRVG